MAERFDHGTRRLFGVCAAVNEDEGHAGSRCSRAIGHEGDHATHADHDVRRTLFGTWPQGQVPADDPRDEALRKAMLLIKEQQVRAAGLLEASSALTSSHASVIKTYDELVAELRSSRGELASLLVLLVEEGYISKKPAEARVIEALRKLGVYG
jgi:hypothetical protein